MTMPNTRLSDPGIPMPLSLHLNAEKLVLARMFLLRYPRVQDEVSERPSCILQDGPACGLASRTPRQALWRLEACKWTCLVSEIRTTAGACGTTLRGGFTAHSYCTSASSAAAVSDEPFGAHHGLRPCLRSKRPVFLASLDDGLARYGISRETALSGSHRGLRILRARSPGFRRSTRGHRERIRKP